MKGIILAGGSGSRLMPLTRHTNKHLLPVAGRPMIHYPLRCLTAAGIDDIVIVTSARHVKAFRRELGDGHGHGAARLEIICEQGPYGIAAALALAEPFCGRQRMCVILGDNIVGGSLAAHLAAYDRQPRGARILLKQVDDPAAYGVARFENGQLIDIEEKPARPAGAMAVIGIYFYPPDVFEVCRGLTPSARGELEITDVNRHYLKRGLLQWEVFDGWWSDAGTFDNLRRVERLLAGPGTGDGASPRPAPPQT